MEQLFHISRKDLNGRLEFVPQHTESRITAAADQIESFRAFGTVRDLQFVGSRNYPSASR
jgi:hypothetical protein